MQNYDSNYCSFRKLNDLPCQSENEVASELSKIVVKTISKWLRNDLACLLLMISVTFNFSAESQSTVSNQGCKDWLNSEIQCSNCAK